MNTFNIFYIYLKTHIHTRAWARSRIHQSTCFLLFTAATCILTFNVSSIHSQQSDTRYSTGIQPMNEWSVFVMFTCSIACLLTGSLAYTRHATTYFFWPYASLPSGDYNAMHTQRWKWNNNTNVVFHLQTQGEKNMKKKHNKMLEDAISVTHQHSKAIG